VSAAPRPSCDLGAIERAPITIDAADNTRLAQFVDSCSDDPGVRAWWHMAAVNAARGHLNDHSVRHAGHVAAFALRILRLLDAHGVAADVVTRHRLSRNDAELVLVAGALLHDVGVAVSRTDHHLHGVALAAGKLEQILRPMYAQRERAIVIAEILHAIAEHRSSGRPLSVEAHVLRVADALDMTADRSRLAMAQGVRDLDALSAAAIVDVAVVAGVHRAVKIRITLNGDIGAYQVEHRLRPRIDGSPLERHISVETVAANPAEQARERKPGPRRLTTARGADAAAVPSSP